MMHSSITRTIYHNSNVNLGPSCMCALSDKSMERDFSEEGCRCHTNKKTKKFLNQNLEKIQKSEIFENSKTQNSEKHKKFKNPKQ
ncbi:Protein CBG25198 [Caenorhabditis briggsae]|uniref:Protein CBG25198 n=1 Tax=Caenorhabditis briggsae TaxID=6238 RepID=B6IJF7_CAEBR|nr:Protein CBG25198 [Caenorhabditis briggsae]CAS00037.1 Protein CBG25198 [Caenorhabditis briggsae]